MCAHSGWDALEVLNAVREAVDLGPGQAVIVDVGGGSTEWIGTRAGKAELVLYVLTEAGGPEEEALLARLGKHRTGKCCLYIRKLSDVDEAVLEELTVGALAYMDEKFPR